MGLFGSRFTTYFAYKMVILALCFFTTLVPTSSSLTNIMAFPMVLLGCFIVLACSTTLASAKIEEHTFHVQNQTVERLCRKQVITVVNGQLPGPVVEANEGDTLVIHVINNSPYNMTIHWHGVFQLRSAWADGPEYVTQCPIMPGNRFTYRFKVTRQEGTLWWHSHSSYLRATVHGAIIIRPRYGRSYPFPRPHTEVPIVFGEWWNANVVDVVDEATAIGGIPNLSNAFTINGQPGDMYPCSSNSTFKLNVKHGKLYLLRIVNAAMQSILFFKIANHNMTVVAVDASYVNPYCTDVVVVAPGQTADVLLLADQHPTSYYMAARPYQGSKQIVLNNSTTTGILIYENSPSSKPKMPILPNTNDNLTANAFLSNLTSLMTAPFWTPVPEKVDERMFITIGLGLVPCGGKGNASCGAFFGQRFAASMNNVSFQPPSKLSMLEAFFTKTKGIYTNDFPVEPPLKFDYTNMNNSRIQALLMTTKGTKAIQVKYNAIVEIVLQGTALGTVENHPMHLHGFDFHVLAQGSGNYNPFIDHMKFNLINPPIRNTVAVPVGGWTVIRFRANNPGVWFLHCHVEVHLPWGLASVIVVENGPTPSTSLPSPPSDLPKC